MEILYALESIRTPLLDKLMSLVTNIGGETAFIAISIIVFWCFSKQCGFYMLTVGFAGTIVNQFLKLWFRIPRPWVKDPNFTIVESARAEATGYSFPSGHAQNTFAALGAPAMYTKNNVLRAVLIVFMILVPFSRMYLGVHTPLDVGISIIIGLLLMIGLYPLFRDMDKKPGRIYAMYVLFIILAVAFVLFVEFYKFPADLDAENYEFGLKTAYMILFCAVGLLLVFHLDRKYIKFTTEAVWWAQLIKLVIGLGIAIGIKAGLKAPLLSLCNGHSVAHGIRYFVLIIFAGIIWPLTFKFFSKLGRK